MTLLDVLITIQLSLLLYLDYSNLHFRFYSSTR